MTEFWELTLRFRNREDAEAAFNAWSLSVRADDLQWAEKMVLRRIVEREG